MIILNNSIPNATNKTLITYKTLIREKQTMILIYYIQTIKANNCKSRDRNFRKEQKLSNQARNQKRFHEHYLQKEHSGICD